jgi:hypothetical protein
MIRRIFRWTIFICGGLLAIAKVSFGAGEPLKLEIIYFSFTDAYVPLWLAVEDRLGRK